MGKRYGGTDAMSENKRPNRYDTRQNMVIPDPKMEILPPARLSDPVAMPPAPAQPIQLDAPVMPSYHTGHMRQTDDAITNARASLLYSKAIGAVASIGITGVLFLAWLNYGGDLGIYFGLEVIGVAGVALVALVVNRSQGLHHSASGIAHHELRTQEKIANRHAQVQEYQIDSQERLAMYAIDKHAELIEKRWRLESGKDE